MTLKLWPFFQAKNIYPGNSLTQKDFNPTNFLNHSKISLSEKFLNHRKILNKKNFYTLKNFETVRKFLTLRIFES